MTEVKMSATVQDEDGTVHSLTMESLHNRISDLENVEVINGEKKKLPVNRVIAEIWESTEILRDINVIYRRIKKYRRVIYVVALVALSYFKWNDVMWLLKEIL